MKIPAGERFLQIARSYMESRILLTAVELDLFSLLAAETLSVEQVAARREANLRGLTILLDAAAAMGLLSKHGEDYRCEPEVACYLSADGAESVLPMLRFMANQWRKWSQLTEIVRGNTEPMIGQRSAENLAAFIGAMEVVSSPLAPSIAAAVKPGSAKALLDVGGGPGTFTRAFLEATPGLRATLFDQPEVIEMARTRLERAGLLGQVTLVGGDFDAEELPDGHDLALVSAIIHQGSPAENLELYRKVWRALEPGGRVIIRDHVLQPDRTHPWAAAVFAINMLVSTAGGNCYTFEEIRVGLEEAGFEGVRLIQESEQMAGVVEAFKPGG